LREFLATFAVKIFFASIIGNSQKNLTAKNAKNRREVRKENPNLRQYQLVGKGCVDHESPRLGIREWPVAAAYNR